MTLKKLGVLGGMGPAATAEFMRLLSRDAPAKCDQDHPRVIVLSDPSIPDRTQAILGLGQDPAPQLRSGLESLAQWGADALAVPCNTAHLFIDRFRGELTKPLIHIVEATVQAAAAASPDGAWLLSTSGTARSGLYTEYALKAGYRFLSPPADMQEIIQQCVTQVKSGQTAEAGAVLRKVAEELWNTDNRLITTACTELPLAYAASGLPPEKEVSSLQALCDACIEFLYRR
ncbi:MAG: amino acid racemase [Alphaproteobacteria bacterium]|nr:amino acid racemase [Alphaproteobacteria bacterium]